MPDPVFNATTGHYYQGVAVSNISWNVALANAAAASYRGLKGYLATVTSAAENATVYAAVSAGPDFTGYFLGASDERVEGQWVWRSGPEAGVAVGYSNWYPGEPNNGGGGGNPVQNYLQILSSTTASVYNGKWDDTWGQVGGSVPANVSGYVIEYGGLPATYRIVANAKAVNEGQRLTFSVYTTNVEWGKTIPYTITGIGNDDLVSGAVSGTLTVGPSGADGLAEISLDLRNDGLTEGNETLTFTVGDQSSKVLVYDTSRTPGYEISTGSASINEGEAAVFLLKTTNVLDGTVLNYTVTGVQAADVMGGLAGSTVVVSGGQAVIAIPTVVDMTAENTTLVVGKDGDGKDITKTLYGVEVMTVTVAGVSASVQVKDWNTRPTFTLTPMASSVKEGSEAKFQLKTTGLMPGAAVRYEISGTAMAADYANPWGGTWGVAKVTGLLNNGTATISIPVLADQLTEGAETLRITVGEGTAQARSATVTILDTSLTPSYTLKAGAASYREGSAALFSISTANVDPLSWVDYQISGVSAADIAIPLQGRLQLDRLAKGSLAVPLVNDRIAEGNELMTVTVEVVGTPVASASTTVIDGL